LLILFGMLNKIFVHSGLFRYYIILICLSILLFPAQLRARVATGACSECHTVHNSQGNDAVAYKLNASYNGFDSDLTPNAMLLVSDCVGCHTSTGASTIVSNVPIVFNTGALSNPLAGGNFSSVRTDDVYGHNVSGIKAQDGNLGLTPPGGTALSSQLTCAGEFGCHGDRSGGNNNFTGLSSAHHTDDSGGITGASVGLSYRYLDGILGKEDSNWEQDNTNTSHNEYNGSTSSSTDTISYLCSQCHGDFHTWEGGALEVGTASPWLRHPTDIALKSSGEYAGYTSYSMTAPVARPDPNAVPSTTQVVPGTDIVMCLSCHRAHASPYYKMLRWDIKSATLATALSGCNVCHTSKN
jgi:hypothetical protein